VHAYMHTCIRTYIGRYVYFMICICMHNNCICSRLDDVTEWCNEETYMYILKMEAQNRYVWKMIVIMCIGHQRVMNPWNVGWMDMPRPIHQSVSQSVSQPVSQSISQSVNQSVSQSVSQSASHTQLVSQSASQSASQSVSLSVNPVAHPATHDRPN